MTKTWHKPKRKWGDRKTRIDAYFHPLRLAAIDEYCKQQSTPEMPVTRSMYLNDLVYRDQNVQPIEQTLIAKDEQRKAQAAKKQRTVEDEIDQLF